MPQEDEVRSTERSNRSETIVAFGEVLTYEVPQFLQCHAQFLCGLLFGQDVIGL